MHDTGVAAVGDQRATVYLTGEIDLARTAEVGDSPPRLVRRMPLTRDSRRAVTWAVKTGSPAGVRFLEGLDSTATLQAATAASIDQAHDEWEAAGRP